MNGDQARIDSTVYYFRQQTSVFSVINLIVIATLLLAHVILAPFWGRLSLMLVVALGVGFLHASVLIWVQAGSSN